MEIITVEEAETAVFARIRDYGVERVSYERAMGRVLAEDLSADRDMPPFNRATVDGIAIDFGVYAAGRRAFRIRATQAAGGEPVPVSQEDECVEIMTGAALDDSVNAVVRYEDVLISGAMAMIAEVEVKPGQNVHKQGKDKRRGETVAEAGSLVTPALIGLAASVGKTALLVRKCPRVVIISTGDEMVSVLETPGPYQLRRSNGITIRAVLLRYGVTADVLHLNDDLHSIKEVLGRCLADYDVLLITGGVSMGKFDHVPEALDSLSVNRLFHRVRQRPGKPFWFGAHAGGSLVFAFPGNPVSVFMCLHRYFLPWLERSLGMKTSSFGYAVLGNDLHVPFPLQYFAQVTLRVTDRGMVVAETVDTNGSGDFSNLIYTDGFLELPMEKQEFRKGEVYKVWRYR